MRRPRTVGGNPFVVFADLTTALAFMFLLCSIALSKGLSDVDRRERQKGLLDKTIRAFATDKDGRAIPGLVSKPLDVEKASDKPLNQYIPLPGSDDFVVKVQTNAALQRIQIGGMYAFGSATHNPRCDLQLDRLVGIVKDLVASQKGSPYVYFQGIAEVGEADRPGARPDEVAKARKELAYARAQEIYDYFKTRHAIADTVAQAVPEGKINPDFAIVIEKSELYSSIPGAATNPKRIPGRVDISVFFTDK